VAIEGVTTSTPADAGNTAYVGNNVMNKPFNPRGRGEHPIDTSADDALILQSPLTRGTRVQIHQSGGVGPSTPARAGNTQCGGEPVIGHNLNPRSRGEHTPANRPKLDPFPQPPLARGTHIHPKLRDWYSPSTPARAGNTPPTRSAPPTLSFNPRASGEHVLTSLMSGHLQPQPPLARGTRTGLPRRREPLTSTPARAGNTTGRVHVAPAHQSTHAEAWNIFTPA
jgi:hypothetical protein